MTHYITALTNNSARLIVKKAEFTNDAGSADLIAKLWEQQGYIIVRKEEA